MSNRRDQILDSIDIDNGYSRNSSMSNRRDQRSPYNRDKTVFPRRLGRSRSSSIEPSGTAIFAISGINRLISGISRYSERVLKWCTLIPDLSELEQTIRRISPEWCTPVQSLYRMDLGYRDKSVITQNDFRSDPLIDDYAEQFQKWCTLIMDLSELEQTKSRILSHYSERVLRIDQRSDQSPKYTKGTELTVLGLSALSQISSGSDPNTETTKNTNLGLFGDSEDHIDDQSQADRSQTHDIRGIKGILSWIMSQIRPVYTKNTEDLVRTLEDWLGLAGDRINRDRPGTIKDDRGNPRRPTGDKGWRGMDDARGGLLRRKGACDGPWHTSDVFCKS